MKNYGTEEKENNKVENEDQFKYENEFKELIDYLKEEELINLPLSFDEYIDCDSKDNIIQYELSNLATEFAIKNNSSSKENVQKQEYLEYKKAIKTVKDFSSIYCSELLIDILRIESSIEERVFNKKVE